MFLFDCFAPEFPSLFSKTAVHRLITTKGRTFVSQEEKTTFRGYGLPDPPVAGCDKELVIEQIKQFAGTTTGDKLDCESELTIRYQNDDLKLDLIAIVMQR